MPLFKKIFTLPGPRDLGMSEYDALESRKFTPNCKGPTWEDWHEKVKSMYPIKYWVLETAHNFILENFWYKASKPVKDFRYWLASHLIPSKRYHFLDLRQPYNSEGIDNYRYGWRDVPEKMLYAMFNLLGEYLNKEEPNDLSLYYSKEQIESDPALKDQQAALEEAKAIYSWWTKERKLEIEKYNELLNEWSNARKNNDPKADSLFKELVYKESLIESNVDEMVLRLVKIRKTLWT